MSNVHDNFRKKVDDIFRELVGPERLIILTFTAPRWNTSTASDASADQVSGMTRGAKRQSHSTIVAHRTDRCHFFCSPKFRAADSKLADAQAH